MKHYCTKKITLGSTAFRQPNAKSHCRFLHGYNLEAKFYFMSDKLDSNNWVVDFGSLKDLKRIRGHHFDHKTIIAEDDPHIEIFKKLHYLEVVDLVFMESVGIEKFAEFCLKKANQVVKNKENNAKCYKVEVFEHEKNSAIAEIES